MTRAFRIAALVAVLHALDDAFLLRGDGVPLTQHAIAAAIAVVATVAATIRFPSLRPGVRAVIAFTFGVLALANGGRHIHEILVDGPTANDLTGAAAAAGGAVLVGVAGWTLFRHRGEGRWATRVLMVPVALAAALFVYQPVATGIVDIHSLDRAVGSPPSPDYRTVAFTASDGVRLEGWYRPSENGAAVLMISGGGGNRTSTLRHAEMLVRHGYGVLVYDPRGSGHSEGTVNSYGWGWEKDAAAALDFLRARSDVDPDRIGTLGLSTGADIAIDIAGRRPDVKAVVADGAAAIGYEDIEKYTDSFLSRASTWVMFKAIEAIQGRSGPDEALADQIARSRAPHLIIAAGQIEKGWGELYDRAGGDRSELWYLPEAAHTAAIRQYPEAYERRVVGFFDEHLQARTVAVSSTPATRTGPAAVRLPSRTSSRRESRESA